MPATEPAGGPGPLHKTTIVIWSAYPGTSVELADLAADAVNGSAYCSRAESVPVGNPVADPDWDGTDFFS